MPKNPHTEQEPWWPEALARFEQLAAEGVKKNPACRVLAREFPRSESTFCLTCDRGSVSAYPAKDTARAAAWQAGQEQYEGEYCPVHRTTTRFSNDGICVECKKDERVQRQANIQAWKAVAERHRSIGETGDS